MPKRCTTHQNFPHFSNFFSQNKRHQWATRIFAMILIKVFVRLQIATDWFPLHGAFIFALWQRLVTHLEYWEKMTWISNWFKPKFCNVCHFKRSFYAHCILSKFKQKNESKTRLDISINGHINNNGHFKWKKKNTESVIGFTEFFVKFNSLEWAHRIHYVIAFFGST